MPKLPRVNYADKIRKANHITFGGYEHTVSARNGAIYDMLNMSSNKYPLLSPRPQRYKIGELTTPNGYYVHDGVYTVDGMDFQYNGESKGIVENSHKLFASMGTKTVIMPDWKYYNSANDTFNAFGTTAQQTVNGAYGGSDYVRLTDNGNGSYTFTCTKKFDTLGIAVPNSINGELYVKYKVTSGGYTRTKTALYGTCSGTVTAINDSTSPYSITFTGTFTYTYTPDEEGVLPSTPWDYNFDFFTYHMRKTTSMFTPTAIFECNNRLWACYGDTIRCSKLGDITDWTTYAGLSTDAWTVEVGSEGDFTGGVNYKGYPTFFKDNRIYRIYGSYPAQFQCVENATSGLLAGCNGSLREVGEVLYYLSPNGITAYTGGSPTNIATPFGLDKFSEAVAGSDGVKYYVSMKNDTQNRYELYAYDTRYGVWEKEGNEQIINFAYNDGLILLKSDGNMWLNGDSRVIPAGSTAEGSVSSYAEFADFIEGPKSSGINEAQPNIKGVSKIQIRLTVGTSSSVTVKISYDGGAYSTVKTLSTADKKSYYLPIVPRRCDHFRLKFEGVGDWCLEGLVFESYTGSELY